MSKIGTPGTCSACGRKEEKGNFLFGGARRLSYCIAPSCNMKGVFFCDECRDKMSRKHKNDEKCAYCNYGHMERKTDFQPAY